MKIKYKIIITILIFIMIFIGIAMFSNEEEIPSNISSSGNEYIYQEINEILNESIETPTEEEKQELNEIKSNFGITGDTELYEVQKGYDNNEIAVIKPSVKYKVAFAGMIKNSKPEINELDSIVEQNHPKYTGICLENSSRARFLDLLKNQTESEYIIDDLRIFEN